MGVYRYGICGREGNAYDKNGNKLFKFSHTDYLHKCTYFAEDDDFVNRVCDRSRNLYKKRAIKMPFDGGDTVSLGRIPYAIEHKPDPKYSSVVWKNYGAVYYYEAFSEDPSGIDNGDYGFPCGYIHYKNRRWEFVEDHRAFDRLGRLKYDTYDDGGDKSWFTPWNEDKRYNPYGALADTYK